MVELTNRRRNRTSCFTLQCAPRPSPPRAYPYPPHLIPRPFVIHLIMILPVLHRSPLLDRVPLSVSSPHPFAATVAHFPTPPRRPECLGQDVHPSRGVALWPRDVSHASADEDFPSFPALRYSPRDVRRRFNKIASVRLRALYYLGALLAARFIARLANISAFARMDFTGGIIPGPAIRWEISMPIERSGEEDESIVRIRYSAQRDFLSTHQR
jgi:hypothetical protein